MNNIKQALESAIEALNLINNHAFRCGIAYEAIKACKAALAEVEASSTNKNSNVLLEKCEPVAWISDDENFIEFRKDSLLELSYKENEIFPLYTSPPQQQWVGLSEDEVVKIYGHITLVDWTKAEAIEAKLKQLNTKG